MWSACHTRARLYGYDRMALFISFILSMTVIPVLWLIEKFCPSLIWHSYLIAYAIEILLIVIIHKACRMKFELKGS